MNGSLTELPIPSTLGLGLPPLPKATVSSLPAAAMRSSNCFVWCGAIRSRCFTAFRALAKLHCFKPDCSRALRDENYLPVPIRLDFLESAAPLAKQVFDAIAAAAAEARVDAPQLHPGETLWEYFHRVDNHFWSPRNELVTPFLAFDQFEEFFTLGRETADRNRRGWSS